MKRYRHLIARGLARALQAGPLTGHGMRARAHRCLGPGLWIDAVVQGLLDQPRRRWMHLELDGLATLIEGDRHFAAAWFADPPPTLRRYILRAPVMQAPRLLALDGMALPTLPTPGDVARWLRVSPAGLWRLSLPSAWQRRRPLAEQHYRCLWHPKPAGGWRLIEAPEPYLRALQRRLLDELLARVPVHEAAHGGVRGRSALSHAQQHLGQPLVWHFDLQDFYASVRASRVHALWRALGYPAAASSCLTALCTTATPEPVLQRLRESDRSKRQIAWQQAMRLRDAHLPQGAPITPWTQKITSNSSDG